MMRKIHPENYNHKTLWVVQNMLNKSWYRSTRCQGNILDQSLQCSLLGFCSSHCKKWEKKREICACKVHEKHCWEKNCSWIPPSGTNFTANSLSHICNGCVCEGWFAFSSHKVSSVWKGHGLVLIPFSWSTKAQSPQSPGLAQWSSQAAPSKGRKQTEPGVHCTVLKHSFT